MTVIRDTPFAYQIIRTFGYVSSDEKEAYYRKKVGGTPNVGLQ